MGYQVIDVKPITGALGAEIDGVDISRPLGNQVFQEVHDALMAHQVIFFRDQNITPQQQVAFGRQFGTLHVHPYANNIPEQPEIVVIMSNKEHRRSANKWHSDVTFQEQPPLGSILLAREVPEIGGDTMWSNMYLAYEALSPRMKAYLGDMKAAHGIGKVRFLRQGETGEARKRLEEQMERAANDVTEHPVVRTHPVTGRKALFVNSGFTQHLVGVAPDESRAILDYLYAHLQKPEFTCRFRWREGSVAFWDNRCTQHYAVPDFGDTTRVMHRVTVNGDRPV